MTTPFPADDATDAVEKRSTVSQHDWAMVSATTEMIAEEDAMADFLWLQPPIQNAELRENFKARMEDLAQTLPQLNTGEALPAGAGGGSS